MKTWEVDILLKEIEKCFDMKHACGCTEWCDCWEKFKKQSLEDSQSVPTPEKPPHKDAIWDGESWD